MTKLYFAYGLNIDKDLMRQKNPGAEFFAIGLLNGHCFIFNECGYPTLIAIKNGVVPGIIWSLTEKDEQSLDSYVGYKEGVYDKCYRKVKTSDGQEVLCFLHIDHCNQTFGQPKQEYLKKIIKGARNFELPERHLYMLSNWPGKKSFKAFNRLMNQIKSGTEIESKIAYYKEEVVPELKNQRDLIFLKAMGKVLEDCDENLGNLDQSLENFSDQAFESIMLNTATNSALAIANSYLDHEIASHTKDLYFLKEFLDYINFLKSKPNLPDYLAANETFHNGNRPYEIATAGIIITDDTNRKGFDNDRVIITNHAKTLEELWLSLFESMGKLYIEGLSLNFLEHFADTVESGTFEKANDLLIEILNRVEAPINQRKNEVENAIKNLIDMTENIDFEEENNGE